MNPLTIIHRRVDHQDSYGLEGENPCKKISGPSKTHQHPKAQQVYPSLQNMEFYPQSPPRPSEARDLRSAMAWKGGTPAKISSAPILLHMQPNPPQVPHLTPKPPLEISKNN